MLISSGFRVDGPPRAAESFSLAEGPCAIPDPLFLLGRLDEPGRARGGVFLPAGVGAAEDEIDFRLWMIDPVTRGGKPVTGRGHATLLGEGSYTLGAVAGDAADPVGAEALYAGDITFAVADDESVTEGGGGAIVRALLNDAGAEAFAVSVANGIGRLILPDLGASWAVHFELVSAEAQGLVLGRTFA